MTTKSVTRDIGKVAAPTVLAVLLWTPVLATGQTVMGAEAVRKYNANPLTVAIPPTLAPQEVKEVMTLTLNSRKWTVAQQSPQEVVGTLDHRGFKAKVILKVDGSLVKILNESQYTSPETGALEPAIPRGWLRNLEKDLNARFAAKVARK
jgi:hypothetical protein